MSDTLEYSIRFLRSFSADKGIEFILSPRGNVTRAQADGCCKMTETEAFFIRYDTENEVRGRGEKPFMIERRVFTRESVSLTTAYSSDAWPRPRVVSAIDLSPAGVRLETTPYSLYPGEELEISFVLRSRAVKCKGKVIHVQDLSSGKQVAGIRFEGLSAEDKRYIETCISQPNRAP